MAVRRTFSSSCPESPVNGGDQQAHQCLDLFFRTIPVLGRESVQRQIFQSELSDRIHNLTDRNDAFLMPEATVFPFALAQRPFPSIIIATCRGKRFLSIFSINDIFYLTNIHLYFSHCYKYGTSGRNPM